MRNHSRKRPPPVSDHSPSPPPPTRCKKKQSQSNYYRRHFSKATATATTFGGCRLCHFALFLTSLKRPLDAWSDLFARYKCCASQSIWTTTTDTMNYTYRNLENVCSEFLSKKQIRCVETSTQKDTQRLSSRERPPPMSDHGLRSSRPKPELCGLKFIPLVSSHHSIIA